MPFKQSDIPNVLIVQPYIPEYRVAFFHALTEHLAEHGTTCHVAAPRPTGAMACRGDEAKNRPDWHIHTRGRIFSLRGTEITSYGSMRLQERYSRIVVPAAATCVDTHWAALRGDAIMWGHIDAYVKPGNWIDQRVELALMKRSRHILSYTPGGRDFAIASGIPPEKVTSVMNTVDLQSLAHQASTLDPHDVDEFRDRHELTEGKTFAFIGGLDASKRIDFLAAVLDAWWAVDRSIKLLVGGRGAQERLLERSVERRQTIWMGYAGAREKALMGATSRALVVPGRIGLVAVEALALQLPVVTTGFQWHAPEVEYLSEGHSLFTLSNQPHTFAEQALMVEPISPLPKPPQLEQMVENYAGAILRTGTAHSIR